MQYILYIANLSTYIPRRLLYQVYILTLGIIINDYSTLPEWFIHLLHKITRYLQSKTPPVCLL